MYKAHEPQDGQSEPQDGPHEPQDVLPKHEAHMSPKMAKESLNTAQMSLKMSPGPPAGTTKIWPPRRRKTAKASLKTRAKQTKTKQCLHANNTA